jgi:hypothetical protein
VQYTTDLAKLSNFSPPLAEGSCYLVGRLLIRILEIAGELVTYEYIHDTFGVLRAFDNRTFLGEMITGEVREEDWLCALLAR